MGNERLIAAGLAALDRTAISQSIEALIGLLDLIDGSPDVELNGDEEDAAWIEWGTMRGSQKGGPNILAGHEDDEDDDPDTGCEDGPCGDDGRPGDPEDAEDEHDREGVVEGV